MLNNQISNNGRELFSESWQMTVTPQFLSGRRRGLFLFNRVVNSSTFSFFNGPLLNNTSSMPLLVLLRSYTFSAILKNGDLDEKR